MHKLIVNFNNTNRYYKKINNTNVHLRETTIKTTETKTNKLIDSILNIIDQERTIIELQALEFNTARPPMQNLAAGSTRVLHQRNPTGQHFSGAIGEARCCGRFLRMAVQDEFQQE